MLEPIQIDAGNEADAAALATALRPIARVRRETADRIAVDGAATTESLVRVLGVVQRVLAQRPAAHALVRLDGREYRMDGG